MDRKLDFKHLAQTYFEAASRLQEQHRSGPAKTHPERLLPIPIAHLTCHGIELALKSNLLFADISLPKIRKLGHGLLELWKQPENASLQREILVRAQECWAEAKESGLWQQQQEWNECPSALLERTLEEINGPHTKSSDYALRYGTEDGHMVLPKTNLIRNAFERQLCMKWPVL